MKIKQIIYFVLILSGALLMGYGGLYVAKEYALAGGIVVLMFGVYKASTSWKKSEPESKNV
ncbi:hypothetical protein I2486_12785 [Cellulophaga sp. E16_2]|uniref:Membrane protein n=1 Tax=Cellulophaga algicola (strain DSM 14237 / IC166 / ACAM 630) TaxID=688270 RepID=E6XAH9_CELAD|nr:MULTISPECIES: hypothetical protein [Cellulophaga]ADV49895.1 membrane protein [Cellulophaga algicola DSM 14237]MBO0592277.1 hypothetical protein [Cellulophaga sp. E16_2]